MIFGQFSKKIILEIYVEIFKNVDTTYIIPNNKNEKIENNNTYLLFIPILISQKCGLDQYYDPSKYKSNFKYSDFNKDLRVFNVPQINSLSIKMMVAKNVLKEADA